MPGREAHHHLAHVSCPAFDFQRPVLPRNGGVAHGVGAEAHDGGFAFVSGPIPIGVGLKGIEDIRADIAGVAHTIAVCVVLEGIVDQIAVVHEVGPRILVAVPQDHQPDGIRGGGWNRRHEALGAYGEFAVAVYVDVQGRQ